MITATPILSPRAQCVKRAGQPPPGQNDRLDATAAAGEPVLVEVYAIFDLASRCDHPLGQAIDLFLRRADAERFIAEVRRDEPRLAERLRVELVELATGERN